MRTVRLDPELETDVQQAAELEGVTVSEFIRRALAKESKSVLARRGTHRLSLFIGSVCSEEPTDATKAKEMYRESVRRKASQWKER